MMSNDLVWVGSVHGTPLYALCQGDQAPSKEKGETGLTETEVLQRLDERLKASEPSPASLAVEPTLEAVLEGLAYTVALLAIAAAVLRWRGVRP